jgi:hypothetical protein
MCVDGDFSNIPDVINETFAHSFLVLTHALTEYHPTFLSAFVKVISMLKFTVPKHLLSRCVTFLKQFKSAPEHDIHTLTNLFEFSKKLGCWDWLKDEPNCSAIISKIGMLTETESAPLTYIFASQTNLFSAAFFKTYDHIMSYPSL